jgi:6-pyruvoyltetrahydropterin/6-carboxytetrahydropterin synthase
MDLTRRYRFPAMHRLHASGLSEADNRDVYGKCNNPYGHGHNYVLEVTVRGPVGSESGQVLDRKELDDLVAGSVLAPFSHADLNARMDRVPTTENLVSEIRERLQDGWRERGPDGGARLARIRLFETRKNICEVDCNA